MFLQRLDITGFKSFAHKTTLEFDRGVASIVGPNGSGKSNVADAIRWALGEQSMKMLRGKKSDDVIFSGSSLKARLGMAEVSMHLNNEDHQMPLDYTEVVITRRVYRSGEGEYLLNNNPVRLQDIHLLLARSNIGQKSYSVIGQGMIDHVLVASPAERKIFFDEAAGVRQYQIKREQAVSKLEQTKENMAQAQMLLTEIEPRLRTLTRQVKRLEKRGVIEADLRSNQQQYYSQRYVELSKELAELDKQFQAQRSRQVEHERALAVLQQELETLEKERTRHEVFEDLQHEYSRVLEQKNAVMKEQAVLEGAHELEAARTGELNVVWLENRDRELARALADLRDEVGALENNVATERSELSKRQVQLSSLLDRLAALEEQLQQSSEQAHRSAATTEAVETELKVFHEEFVQFQQQAEKAETEQHLGKIKREINRLYEKLTGVLKRFQTAREGLQTADLIKLQEEFRAFAKDKDALTGEIHSLKTELEKKAARLGVLQESEKRLTDEHDRAQRELERLHPGGATAGNATRQRHTLDEHVRSFDAQLQKLREQIVNFNRMEQKKKDHVFQLQKSFRVKQNELSQSTSEVNATRVEQAKLETRKDDIAREIRSEMPAEAAEAILLLNADSVLGSHVLDEKLLAAIDDRKHQLELIGGIDEGVTAEFHQTDERYAFLSAQVEDLDKSVASLEQIIEELDATIKNQFHKAFTLINNEFGKFFKILFNGGNAKLALQEEVIELEETGKGDNGDEEDDEDETPSVPQASRKKEKVIAGIDIIATPPGKRISGIAMLSGGERALTSIALICAILANRPSPFVILDEVDAALDEANTQRFAAILRELAHTTQFITITHNRSTMQISSILYGMTMGDDGVSKLLSIKMEEAERVMEQQGNRS